MNENFNCELKNELPCNECPYSKLITLEGIHYKVTEFECNASYEEMSYECAKELNVLKEWREWHGQ